MEMTVPAPETLSQKVLRGDLRRGLHHQDSVHSGVPSFGTLAVLSEVTFKVLPGALSILK